MTMFTEETSADWNNVIEYFVRIGDFYFPTDEHGWTLKDCIVKNK